MSDPDRLIEGTGTPEARLLAAALDEPPPRDLLLRTLAAIGTVAPSAALAGTTSAGATGNSVVAVKASSGILGAVAAGTLAGVLVVAGYAVFAGADSQPSQARTTPLAASGARATPAFPGTAAASVSPVTPRMAPAPPTPPSTAPPDAPSPPAGTARPRELAAELALLDEATRALHAGDRRRAHALLARYAREIPHGQLQREADRLRAEVDAAPDAGETIP